MPTPVDPRRHTGPDREDRRRRLERIVPTLPPGIVVLDVGSGSSPYRYAFEPVAKQYVAVDLGPPASIIGASEHLPVRDESVDVVVSFQMLEHVDSPETSVAEFRRVLKPGGTVLLTTHGVYPYHPNPRDYWRWTGEGLKKLFANQGLEAEVEGMTGTGTTIAMLLSYYVHLTKKRHAWGQRIQWLIPVMLRAGRAFDRRVPELSDHTRSGSMFLDYFVVGRKPRA